MQLMSPNKVIGIVLEAYGPIKSNWLPQTTTWSGNACLQMGCKGASCYMCWNSYMGASSALPIVPVWVFCTSWARSLAPSVKHNTQGITPFTSFNLDKSRLPLLPPISELMAPAGRRLGHCASEQSEGSYFPGANQWNPYSSWCCLSLEESGSDYRWTFHLKTQLNLSSLCSTC